MARDINRRLEQLRVRRAGVDRLDRLVETARTAVLEKSRLEEGWQKRARTQPNTRYALGAMEEVDADSTRISIETAERVGRQLKTSLTPAGYAVEFRLQGSVPLNVHIRGVSDVDLLDIGTSLLTYDRSGRKSKLGLYGTTEQTSLGTLVALRKESEKILKASFPAADVDVSGNKSIKIHGGSLARPVDVVPSHWYDSEAYQESEREHDRGVVILNKSVPETLKNFPFMHIKLVGDRCDSVYGGLRKAIRLIKNVKADAEKDGKDMPLPSFDLAATMYHANLDALRAGVVFELAVLAEAQRHLDALATNHEYAESLWVPDSSRRIFDSPSKLAGLTALSYEMDDLVREVAKEHNPGLALLPDPPLSECRKEISLVLI